MKDALITVFGSSRQDAIKQCFRTTGIREEIGDTPSTKEIIQAIEFCKAADANVRRDFENTDVFVIEISARDAEVESDLCRIKQLLEPKKILIVSDLINGERIERLCLKHDLPFLRPSDYLYAEKDVYNQEAGFTEHGHRLMGRVYKRVIEDMFKTKTVVFVVKQQYANMKKTNTDNFWGLGDTLRSIYYIYKTSFVSDFKVLVDLFHHPISAYIECRGHKYQESVKTNADNVLFYGDNILSVIETGFKTTDVLYMFVHQGVETYMPTDYDIDIQLFVKKNLQPNAEMREYIECKTNGLDVSTANIIHYRLGDKELVNGNVDANKIYLCYRHLLRVLPKAASPLPKAASPLPKAASPLPKAASKAEPKSILLTDSDTLKMLVSANNHSDIVLYDHPICHIGYDIDAEEIKNSLFEFFIATRAKSIQTYTVYGWISGFMYSIHKIYNVPITDMQRNLEYVLYQS